MDDTIKHGPDEECLFGVATEQQGYFTTAQAAECGYGRDLLTYHTKTGRFIRVYRGVYRLRDYPSWPREEVMAAWLRVGKDKAVVSHESALDLLDLSDVIPTSIHLTVPRSQRHKRRTPEVALHTTTRPFDPMDVTTREGVKTTSATRTILDAAEAGTSPEQIQMAVRQALRRGLTTRRLLEERLHDRERYVQDLVLTAFPTSDR